MKHILSTRSFLNIGLLCSALMLLSGCNFIDWIKRSTGCTSCETGHGDHKLGGEVLMTLNGKPAITTESFEEFWKESLSDDPQLSMAAQFMPNAREELFKSYELEKVIQEWMKDTKKDQDPEYKRKLEKELEKCRRKFNITIFRDEIVKNLDTSDDALKKFYEENREKNAVFQQPPFLTTAEGTKLQTVQFSDEKQAKDFAEKAKKAGANFDTLAKAAKKQVKDLGLVSGQSRNVEPAIRFKARDLKAGDVEIINVGAKQFAVVKAGAKQPAEFAQFENEKVKEALKELLPQFKLYEAFMSKFEELKKQFNVDDTKAKELFKAETEKRKADMQAQLKAAPDQEQTNKTHEQEGPGEQTPDVTQESTTAV